MGANVPCLAEGSGIVCMLLMEGEGEGPLGEDAGKKEVEEEEVVGGRD